MIISIIAAMSENRVIGMEGRLPWHLPNDLKRFRSLTLGHAVIMGRKTHEGIGKALPGRKNIVVTRQTGYRSEGCFIVPDLPGAFAECSDDAEVFILGGQELFQQAMPISDRIYLTIVRATITGDKRFPEITDDFIVVKREEAEDRFPLTFVMYERRGNSQRRD